MYQTNTKYLECQTLNFWHLSLAKNGHTDTSMTIGEAIAKSSALINSLGPSRRLLDSAVKLSDALIQGSKSRKKQTVHNIITLKDHQQHV